MLSKNEKRSYAEIIYYYYIKSVQNLEKYTTNVNLIKDLMIMYK